MRRGVGRPASAVRMTIVLAMNRTAWLASVVATAIGAYLVSPVAQAAGQPAARRSITFNGTAAVGALFTSSNGRLGSHFCTASVVSSPAGDLLITAAHCLQGKSLSPAGSIVFAPGYHNRTCPYRTSALNAADLPAPWPE